MHMPSIIRVKGKHRRVCHRIACSESTKYYCHANALWQSCKAPHTSVVGCHHEIGHRGCVVRIDALQSANTGMGPTGELTFPSEVKGPHEQICTHLLFHHHLRLSHQTFELAAQSSPAIKQFITNSHEAMCALKP